MDMGWTIDNCTDLSWVEIWFCSNVLVFDYLLVFERFESLLTGLTADSVKKTVQCGFFRDALPPSPQDSQQGNTMRDL